MNETIRVVVTCLMFFILGYLSRMLSDCKKEEKELEILEEKPRRIPKKLKKQIEEVKEQVNQDIEIENVEGEVNAENKVIENAGQNI